MVGLIVNNEIDSVLEESDRNFKYTFCLNVSAGTEEN